MNWWRLDEDGTALDIHEGQDAYKIYPAADAGPRIVCGPFRSDRIY